jgi:hypothetical protein
MNYRTKGNKEEPKLNGINIQNKVSRSLTEAMSKLFLQKLKRNFESYSSL